MFKLDGLGDKEDVVTGEQTDEDEDEEEAFEGDLECLVEIKSDWDVVGCCEGDITGDSVSSCSGDNFCFLWEDSIDEVDDDDEEDLEQPLQPCH